MKRTGTSLAALLLALSATGLATTTTEAGQRGNGAVHALHHAAPPGLDRARPGVIQVGHVRGRHKHHHRHHRSYGYGRKFHPPGHGYRYHGYRYRASPHGYRHRSHGKRGYRHRSHYRHDYGVSFQIDGIHYHFRESYRR